MPHLDDLSDDELGRHLQRALRALPDAPPALQRSAIGLWPPAPAALGLMGAAQALVQRIAGALTFDSWTTPALASGMRSLRSPTRQLLFSAGGRDIDLRITPADGAFALAGQVLGPDETGRVELSCLDGGSVAAQVATLDELGEFRLEGLAQGVYSLRLLLGGDEVLLPPFDLGEPLR
jgi:hypothetical protein